MGEILTQREIDALLKGAPAALVPPPDVTPYAFLPQTRVSKDSRAVLETLFGRFATELQSLLTMRLHGPTGVDVQGIEQITFAEYLMTLSSPCAAFLFPIASPPVAQGVLELGNELASFLIDRLFGGTGESEPLERPLTPLERGVLQGLVERTLVCLREAWQPEIAINTSNPAFESDPAMLQIAGREDNVLVVLLEVRSLAFRATASLCLPMRAITPALQKKTPRAGSSAAATPVSTGTIRERLRSDLRHARLALSARFPEFLLRTRDLSTLAVGQTILTGQTVETPMEVLVNGQRRYKATLGQQRRRFALRIVQFDLAPDAERPDAVKEGRVS